jgi:hypothetical protein
MITRRRDSACKTLGRFAAIPVVIVLMVSSSYSAAGLSTETATSTIITRQDNNQTGTSSIGDRIDDLIASAINNTMTGDGIDNMELSGNIASARFDLDSGQVEQTLFGNWSAEISSIENSTFEADFRNGTGGEHYVIGNLTLNSFQRVNDHVALGGTVDVSEQTAARSWQGAAVSIVIIDGRALAISFEDPQLNEIFSNQPIMGVVSP